MNDTFCTKILTFVKEVEALNEAGWSKKKIAQELSIFPSVLSVIINKLAIEIDTLVKTNNTRPADISQIFNNINNISEKNIRQKIDGFIEKLRMVNAKPLEKEDSPYLSTLIYNTPFDKLHSFCGIYHCYYLSSFSYKVKKEPLYMDLDKQSGKIWAQKGNKIGPTRLKGIMYTTNNQVLTMQLLEKDTVVADQFIAHFILPPLYTKIEILKGVAISVSNSYLPISRKVILKKVSDVIDYNNMDTIETVFYDKEELSDPIVNYLYAEKSYLEYYHTPHPSFDEDDLEKELQIMATT